MRQGVSRCVSHVCQDVCHKCVTMCVTSVSRCVLQACQDVCHMCVKVCQDVCHNLRHDVCHKCVKMCVKMCVTSVSRCVKMCQNVSRVHRGVRDCFPAIAPPTPRGFGQGGSIEVT